MCSSEVWSIPRFVFLDLASPHKRLLCPTKGIFEKALQTVFATIVICMYLERLVTTPFGTYTSEMMQKQVGHVVRR